jgi:hypothetical protein
MTQTHRIVAEWKTDVTTDVHLFNDDNLLLQLETAPFTLGCYTLKFYTEGGKPVNRKTETVSEFYLYPSGGTLRDSTFNIIFYDSRFDTYRGFQPPHLRRSAP